MGDLNQNLREVGHMRGVHCWPWNEIAETVKEGGKLYAFTNRASTKKTEGAGRNEKSLEAWIKEGKNPPTFGIDGMPRSLAYVMIHGGSLLTQKFSVAFDLLKDLSELHVRYPKVPFALCTQRDDFFSFTGLFLLLAHVGSKFAFLVHKMGWSKSLVLEHMRSTDLQPLLDRREDQCKFFMEQLDNCLEQFEEHQVWVSNFKMICEQLLEFGAKGDCQPQNEALKTATETAIRLATAASEMKKVLPLFADGAFDAWLDSRWRRNIERHR